MIVLAVLRHDQRLADIAGGNDVSESTVRRWRDELIGLLSAQAPRLDRALKKVAKQGGEVVLIDGTLIRTRRRTGKADRRNYSGKHRSHGLHFLALTDENGRLIWISVARPGRTHDNTAARHDHILAHLRAAGLGALADLGFRGLDNDILDPVIVTGYICRLRPPQELADPHQTPHQPRPRHPPPARPARPDEHRNQPLTDDLLRGLPPTTSTNAPRTNHTSPLTCDFRLAAAQWTTFDTRNAQTCRISVPAGPMKSRHGRSRGSVSSIFGQVPPHCSRPDIGEIRAL
ncbi:transposase family protein [Streptomyces sp. NPDC004096]